MKRASFLVRYLAVVAVSGMSGLAGTIIPLILIGGIRDPNAWDMLSVVQLGGLPSAAITYRLSTPVMLKREPHWSVVVALLIAAEATLPWFFRFVVDSGMTGIQGQVLAVLTLILAGYVVATYAPAPSAPKEKQAPDSP